MKRILYIVLLLLTACSAELAAQNTGAVVSGNTMRVPRIIRGTFTDPVSALLLFDTVTHHFYGYNGTDWVILDSSASGADTITYIYYDTTENQNLNFVDSGFGNLTPYNGQNPVDQFLNYEYIKKKIGATSTIFDSSTQWSVDTILYAVCGCELEGHSYLIGEGATGDYALWENQIMQVVGGVPNYHEAADGDYLAVQEEDNPRIYKFENGEWVLQSILVEAGGNYIAIPLDIGPKNSQNLRFKTKNIIRERISPNGDHYFLKFKNHVPLNNFAYIDSTTGQLKVDTTHELTLTTIGSSGPATLSGYNLNIPEYAGGVGGSTTLAGLDDVDFTSLGNGQLISYNSSSGKWENFTPSYLTTISGITAGGDLSGTYPNPTVAKLNGQLPSYYLDRANHTGTQSYSTITGLGTFATLNSPATTSGDLIYYNGSSYSKLSIGSTNQVLSVVGGAPSWGATAFLDSITISRASLGAYTARGTNIGLSLINPTAATASVVQYPPLFQIAGNSYNTTDAASVQIPFYITVVPAIGAFGAGAAGRGSLVIRSARLPFTTNLMALDENGLATFASNVISGGTIQAGNGAAISGITAGSQIIPGTINAFTPSARNYRTTNAGSNISPQFALETSNTSGNQGLISDYVNATPIGFTIKNTNGAGFLNIQVAKFSVTNITPTAGSEAGDLSVYTGLSGGTERVRFGFNGVTTLFKPLGTSGSTPSYTAGTGAGTSPTISITGNDAAGYISITTGTTPTLAGTVMTFTFNTTLANTPKSIQLTAGNAAAATALANIYIDQSTASTTAFNINNTTLALPAATPYIFYYSVTQ